MSFPAIASRTAYCSSVRLRIHCSVSHKSVEIVRTRSKLGRRNWRSLLQVAGDGFFLFLACAASSDGVLVSRVFQSQLRSFLSITSLRLNSGVVGGLEISGNITSQPTAQSASALRSPKC